MSYHEVHNKFGPDAKQGRPRVRPTGQRIWTYNAPLGRGLENVPIYEVDGPLSLNVSGEVLTRLVAA